MQRLLSSYGSPKALRSVMDSSALTPGERTRSARLAGFIAAPEIDPDAIGSRGAGRSEELCRPDKEKAGP
jgi:hypothetical protein